MTSAPPGQSRALLRLRWSMLRTTPRHGALVGLIIAAIAVLLTAVTVAASVRLGAVVDSVDPLAGLTAGDLPPDRTGEIRVLVPTVMLAFLITCVIGPISAGGAYELVPSSQLVAFPVRARTIVRLSLMLSPLNIAWYLQVALLATATAYSVRGPFAPVLPLLALAAFVAACTCTGQAVGWLLVWVRRRRAGRITTWLLVFVALVALLGVVHAGRVSDVLDASPTVRVMVAVVAAADNDAATWIPRSLVLIALAVACYLVAVGLAGLAGRRAADKGADPQTQPIARRVLPTNHYRALVSVDRASVWRSVPLRRGLIVLGALPGLAGLLAGLSWQSIALLPPLAASGAVLLFGVNAMCLDGSGAIWLATLPHDPVLVLRAKRRVVLEVCSGAVAVVLAVCATRTGRVPTTAEVAAVMGSAVACAVLVSSMGMRTSVRKPYRADLQGPRDTPAPPGAMALYSTRLAGITTLLGLLFSGLSVLSSPWAALGLTAVVVGWAEASWRATQRHWALPEVRATVVATVAAG